MVYRSSTRWDRSHVYSTVGTTRGRHVSGVDHGEFRITSCTVELTFVPSFTKSRYLFTKLHGVTSHKTIICKIGLQCTCRSKFIIIQIAYLSF